MAKTPTSVANIEVIDRKPERQFNFARQAAALAMQGQIGRSQALPNPQDCAKTSVRFAEALLNELIVKGYFGD